MTLTSRSRIVVHRLMNRFLGTNKPLHRILPDDIFLCSFPRSGNTWIRLMLAYYLSPDKKCDPRSVHAIIPDVHSGDIDTLTEVPRPRIIKSHFTPIHEYPRIIYLVRDGRDVCVSYYDLCIKKYGYKADFEDFVKDLCAGRLFPSPWHIHVMEWLQKSDTKPLLFVRYEDILVDPAGELAKMLRFAGYETDGEKLKSAVENTRLETIWSQIRATPENQAVGFAGGVSGKAGKWREVFSDSLHSFFLDVSGRALKRCGYV